MNVKEYDKQMEAQGAHRVGVVEHGSPYSGNIHSELFMTEPEAQAAYDAIPDGWYRNKYRTWDIWGWVDRQIQKEFDRLADAEEAAFYAYCADRDNPELKAAHEKAKAELVAYFERTRCHNS